MRSMTRLLQDSFERLPDALPLGEQLFQHQLAVARDFVETLVALVFFAPFAGQQPLALQAAKQRIERAFVHLQAALGKPFTQGIAVLFVAKLGQNRQNQAAPAKLQPQILQQTVVPVIDTLRHIVYGTYYVTHSNNLQYPFSKKFWGN